MQNRHTTTFNKLRSGELDRERGALPRIMQATDAPFPRIFVRAALVVTPVYPFGLKPSQALACGCVRPLPRVDRSFSTLNLEVRLDNVMIQ